MRKAPGRGHALLVALLKKCLPEEKQSDPIKCTIEKPRLIFKLSDPLSLRSDRMGAGIAKDFGAWQHMLGKARIHRLDVGLLNLFVFP